MTAIKRSKKLLLTLTAIAVMNTAQAGVLADMNSMFMSNSTAPGSMTTKDRAGFFGGSMEMRTPIQNVNLIGFDPPRFSAGCGGFDLYSGSFSFINSQQLIALFRNIASNAAGLLFKAAIKAISPSLDQLLTEFQSLLQNMNNLGKNTCSLAHLITDPISQAVTENSEGTSAISSTINGTFSDMTNILSGLNQNFSSTVNKTAQFNPQTGNQVVKAVTNSGASSMLGLAGLTNYDGSGDNASDPNSLNNRILYSIIGFSINGTNCRTGDQNLGTVQDTPSGPSQVGRTGCNSPGLITLRDLNKGGGTGSTQPQSPLKLYQCMNPGGYGTPDGGTDPQMCTQMQTTDFNYYGVQGYVNTMLFGTADPATPPDTTSIIGQFNTGSSVTLSPTQINFISQLDFPLIRLASMVSNSGDRTNIGRKMSTHISECVTAKLGEALLKTANLVRKDNNYQFTDDQLKNIDRLREDYIYFENACIRDQSYLQIAQTINSTTRLNGQVK